MNDYSDLVQKIQDEIATSFRALPSESQQGSIDYGPTMWWDGNPFDASIIPILIASDVTGEMYDVIRNIAAERRVVTMTRTDEYHYINKMLIYIKRKKNEIPDPPVDFNAQDFKNLQDAYQETLKFAEFLKDRFISMLIITGETIPRLAALRVPEPLKTMDHPKPKHPGVGQVFNIRQVLGGDQYGNDYEDFYLPVDFALGGNAADEALRQEIATIKRREAMRSAR